MERRAWKLCIGCAAGRNLARQLRSCADRERRIGKQTRERTLCPIRIAELLGRGPSLYGQALLHAGYSCRCAALVGRRPRRQRNALRDTGRSIEVFSRQRVGTHRHGSSRPDRPAESGQNEPGYSSEALQARIDDAL